MKRLKLIALVLVLFTTVSYGAVSSYNCVSVSYPVLVNGQALTFADAPPMNYNGRTMLPLRSISEAVGVPIEWNNTTKSVEINTVDVEELKKACVMINAEGATKGTQGSAVCWDYGEYLTANHIVADGKTSIKCSDVSDFKIGKTDAGLDVATLKTDNDIKPVKIGDSEEVKPGDTVILISSPNGKDDTVSYGNVEINNTWIIVNGESDEGSSGGGLFNLDGELIGILVSGETRIGEYCIVPINKIREAL